MSQLNIDTIQNRSGGPVTLTKQAAAKCIFSVAYDGTAINNTSGGINTSSLTDGGTGDRTISWTNNISSRTYMCHFDNTGYFTDVYDRTAQVYHDFATDGVAGMDQRTGALTSSLRFVSFYEGSARAHYDYDNYGVVHGDLA
jgi:hypothetical protein